VAQRTREFGIRQALGAQPHHILGLILRESGELTLYGMIAGLILAFISIRVVANQIYSISHVDPLTYGGVGLLVVAMTLAASYIPARRAGRVDPMVTLRYE
jgi:ABC-type antimicrobial peptide transport system permease subunit